MSAGTHGRPADIFLGWAILRAEIGLVVCSPLCFYVFEKMSVWFFNNGDFFVFREGIHSWLTYPAFVAKRNLSSFESCLLIILVLNGYYFYLCHISRDFFSSRFPL